MEKHSRSKLESAPCLNQFPSCHGSLSKDSYQVPSEMYLSGSDHLIEPSTKSYIAGKSLSLLFSQYTAHLSKSGRSCSGGVQISVRTIPQDAVYYRQALSSWRQHEQYSTSGCCCFHCACQLTTFSGHILISRTDVHLRRSTLSRLQISILFTQAFQVPQHGGSIAQ